MDRNKVKTIVMWILYVAVCLCSVALPVAERAIRKNLTGKEENNEFDDFAYYRRHNNYRRV